MLNLHQNNAILNYLINDTKFDTRMRKIIFSLLYYANKTLTNLIKLEIRKLVKTKDRKKIEEDYIGQPQLSSLYIEIGHISKRVG